MFVPASTMACYTMSAVTTGASRAACVGTRARLGYTEFDAQLRKAYFVTTLYAIHICVSHLTNGSFMGGM